MITRVVVCGCKCVVTAAFALVICSVQTQTATAVLPRRGGGWIPNTEGLVLVSGAQLSNLDLRGLDADAVTLFGATFENSDLTGAYFGYQTSINDVNFTNAIIKDATLNRVLPEQVESTASYKSGDLTGVSIISETMEQWDFRDQNLTEAGLFGDFPNATFAGANLRKAAIGQGDFQGADFTDANISQAVIRFNTLTADQLYKTSSYQAGDLRGVRFVPGGFFTTIPYDLVGVDLSGQDLAKASLPIDATNGNLTNANFADAELSRGNFEAADFRGATFAGASLRSTNFSQANLEAVDLSRLLMDNSVLTEANMVDAVLFRTNLFSSDLAGANLNNANLVSADLRDATFTGAQLSNARLQNASLALTNGLSDAIFDANSQYNQWTEFPSGFDPISVGLQFVESPAGDFNGDLLVDAADIDLLNDRLRNQPRPSVAEEIREGLFLIDRDGDVLELALTDQIRGSEFEDVLEEVRDIFGEDIGFSITTVDGEAGLEVFLTSRDVAASLEHNPEAWLTPMFDLTGDGLVNSQDLTRLLDDELAAIPGDTNLDGSVDFIDFLSLSANYRVKGGWAEGDFDRNGIVQFQDFLVLSENYGERTVRSVPEPSTLMLCFGMLCVAFLRRKRSKDPR